MRSPDVVVFGARVGIFTGRECFLPRLEGYEIAEEAATVCGHVHRRLCGLTAGSWVSQRVVDCGAEGDAECCFGWYCALVDAVPALLVALVSAAGWGVAEAPRFVGRYSGSSDTG